jgi:hypothetical protein
MQEGGGLLAVPCTISRAGRWSSGSTSTRKIIHQDGTSTRKITHQDGTSTRKITH